MGSAALNMALVASGSADVYYEWGIHCWDIAAGKLLIEEAGGIVASTRGIQRSVALFILLNILLYANRYLVMLRWEVGTAICGTCAI